MSAPIYGYPLEKLDHLEGDVVALKSFDFEIAWEIGLFARKRAIQKFPSKAVVINICTPTGHVLFHTVTAKGTSLDNDEWVRRKRNTVFRMEKSSFYVGQKLRSKGKSLEEASFISSRDYATHGGSVPIRITSSTNVVGALTISGLAQEDDHLLALDILGEFVNSNYLGK